MNGINVTKPDDPVRQSGAASASKVTVSLVQFDARVLQPETNLARMREAIEAEAAAGARLIVFPELSNTGYVEPVAAGAAFSEASGGSSDFALRLYQAAEAPEGAFTQMLLSAAREHGVHLVVGLALRHPVLSGVMFNASMLVGPGGVMATYHKLHAWHLEKLYFTPGDKIVVQETALGRIGMQICYDIRFPELTRIMALQGAEIITSVWASAGQAEESVADPQLFTHRAYTRAIENGVFFLSCNRAGTQGAHQFYGRSVVVAPNGTVLAQSLSDREEVVRAELDLLEVARYRSFTGILADRRPDVYARYGLPL